MLRIVIFVFVINIFVIIMSFKLSTESYLSVREVSVESLQPPSDLFINDSHPGQNLANCGGKN